MSHRFLRACEGSVERVRLHDSDVRVRDLGCLAMQIKSSSISTPGGGDDAQNPPLTSS
jgi:hypothetical protein